VSNPELTIIQPNFLTVIQREAVITLGSRKSTKTAYQSAAKTLHAAFLTADPRASATTMMSAASNLAAVLKTGDEDMQNGRAYARMRAHLIKTNDHNPFPSKRPTEG